MFSLKPKYKTIQNCIMLFKSIPKLNKAIRIQSPSSKHCPASRNTNMSTPASDESFISSKQSALLSAHYLANRLLHIYSGNNPMSPKPKHHTHSTIARSRSKSQSDDVIHTQLKNICTFKKRKHEKMKRKKNIASNKRYRR